MRAVIDRAYSRFTITWTVRSLLVFRRQTVLLQKFVNRRENSGPLLRSEIAVLAARNGQQLIRNPGFRKSLMQADGMIVRNGCVGVAVNREDRRKPRTYVSQRRYAPGKFFAVR